MATGLNRKYLYQIATARRRPGVKAARLLVAADARLNFEALLLGEIQDRVSRSTTGADRPSHDAVDKREVA